MNKPIVTIEMASGGKIVCELYPETAPESVKNFVSLISHLIPCGNNLVLGQFR